MLSPELHSGQAGYAKLSYHLPRVFAGCTEHRAQQRCQSYCRKDQRFSFHVSANAVGFLL